MADVEPAELLRWVRKYGRLLAAGKITTIEFADTLLDQLAAVPGSNTDLAGEVAASLPPETCAAMAAVIGAALRPGYRKPAWHYGGPHRRTSDDVDAESRFRTERVRSWAAALEGPLSKRVPSAWNAPDDSDSRQ